jgi:hypothetical protein
VAGNITVPGGVCVLQDVTVTGNVTVSPGAELIMRGGGVNGGIAATDAWISVGPSGRSLLSVGGSIKITAPRNWRYCDVLLGGNLTVSGQTGVAPPPLAFPPCTPPAGAFGIPGPIGGHLTIVNNTVPECFHFTAVNGPFTATGNAGGNFDHLTIAGSATCSNTPPALFTNSTVGGSNSCPG